MFDAQKGLEGRRVQGAETIGTTIRKKTEAKEKRSTMIKKKNDSEKKAKEMGRSPK